MLPKSLSSVVLKIPMTVVVVEFTGKTLLQHPCGGFEKKNTQEMVKSWHPGGDGVAHRNQQVSC